MKNIGKRKIMKVITKNRSYGCGINKLYSRHRYNTPNIKTANTEAVLKKDVACDKKTFSVVVCLCSISATITNNYGINIH